MKSPINVFLLCAILFAQSYAAEWQGYEGGGERHNASPAKIAGTELLWLRTVKPFFHERMRKREGSGYASRNLVTFGDSIAVIGIPNGDEVEESKRDEFAELTLLHRHTGETRAILATKGLPGCNSVSRNQLPTGFKGNAVNVPGAFQVLHWDRSTGHLFIRSGGDLPAMSALAPISKISQWKPGSILPVHGPYDPDSTAKDPRGKTRSELPTAFHTYPFEKGEPDIGLGSSYLDFRGANKPAFFSVDEFSPLIVAPNGAGHVQTSFIQAWNKHTGLRNMIHTLASTTPPVFSRDAVLVHKGIVYCITPSQDADGSGDLGNVYGIFKTRPNEGKDGKYVFARNDPGGPDQGMRLYAHRYILDAEGLVTGFEEVFTADFPSTHLPRRAIHDAYSYVETDGLIRDKSIALLNGRMYVAWKPGLNEHVQLVWADTEGSGVIDAGVGYGLRGQDIWPRMSLQMIEGKPHIVYASINAYNREYLVEKYPWSAEKGSWSAERTAPRGPSEIACIDLENETVKWTQNLTEQFPGLPVNDYWLYADRVQMVAAGDQAWMGWVDLSQETARLALAAYDLTADEAVYQLHHLDLPFQSDQARFSYCTDLIAVDGTLYGIITESDTLWPGAPAKDHFNHTAQHVVAIGKP